MTYSPTPADNTYISESLSGPRDNDTPDKKLPLSDEQEKPDNSHVQTSSTSIKPPQIMPDEHSRTSKNTVQSLHVPESPEVVPGGETTLRAETDQTGGDDTSIWDETEDDLRQGKLAFAIARIFMPTISNKRPSILLYF